MNGLLLHLSAPMQAWGADSQFGTRLTHPHPTRSGLTGLLACTLGRTRGEPLHDLAALSYTIRVDRPGQRLRDYHTVGGGYPRERTVITADGKRRNDATSTLVSHRWYIADAAFTVAVTGPADTIETVARALRYPVWQPYLGRRSCPPDSPLLIAAVDDPVAALHLMPLHRGPDRGRATVDVMFLLDHAPQSGLPPTAELRDNPNPDGSRAFATRPQWQTTRPMPADLCAGYGTAWLASLTAWRDTLTDPATAA
ncbi:type I-E CRISPR-associated protein Cas5/CasD [Streptomyces sp. NPDC003631]